MSEDLGTGWQEIVGPLLTAIFVSVGKIQRYDPILRFAVLQYTTFESSVPFDWRQALTRYRDCLHTGFV